MKSSQNSLVVRVVAGLFALILILGILFITNAFVGNPISAMMASRAIEEYANQNYSFLDLEVEKTIYDFKSSNYVAKAHSKTSIDTKFSIYYADGEVHRDDYEDNVLEGFNTLQRLSDEYSYIAKNIISQELGFKDNRTMVNYYKEEYENIKDIIELDMRFDRTLSLDAEVTINIHLKNNSLEEVAKILTKAHKVFLNNDCVFEKYGLYAENDEGRLVSVHGVTPKNIEDGKLLKQLEKALEQEERRQKELEEGKYVEEREEREDIMEEVKDKEEVEEEISVYIRE